MTIEQSLTLQQFFPYQLTKLQAAISDSIAQIYTGKFNLTRQEWRILAILASNSPLTAKEIGTQANLEKMPASRAIQRMDNKALLVKTANKHDKRSSLLQLSSKGIALYQELEPLVLAREQQLLSVLTSDERQLINDIMQRLHQQAQQID
ncbi:MarR family transcriptional regulator [Thalassotalea sp. G2M2-11]|uniref:MarR family winged helix-turn-helix transcriptional regulator n=1 Tax=Thalassotalea sp. G2M2-11 TaxID=2787627 RepID=UPI0019D13743|nr:MarR family transcriptional regulator [Thalassotalea sp. G2M2-11]